MKDGGWIREFPAAITVCDPNGIILALNSPWYEDGRFAGLVELSLPIPKEMPHFVRDKK